MRSLLVVVAAAAVVVVVVVVIVLVVVVVVVVAAAAAAVVVVVVAVVVVVVEEVEVEKSNTVASFRAWRNYCFLPWGYARNVQDPIGIQESFGMKTHRNRRTQTYVSTEWLTCDITAQSEECCVAAGWLLWCQCAAKT